MVAIIRLSHTERFIPCVMFWHGEPAVIKAIVITTLDDRCVVAKRSFPRFIKDKNTPPRNGGVAYKTNTLGIADQVSIDEKLAG